MSKDSGWSPEVGQPEEITTPGLYQGWWTLACPEPDCDYVAKVWDPAKARKKVLAHHLGKHWNLRRSRDESE